MTTHTEKTETLTEFTQPVRATWPLSADAFLEAATSYSEETRDLMLSVFRWCIDPKHPVTRGEFARRVGYDETTVYKFFANRYLHPETKVPQLPPEKFLQGCREFLRLERERAEGGSTEFVLTPTAKRIETFFDLVRESSSMGVMWGPSHVGKTWTAEHYQQANNHGRTIYCRMHAASGLGGMVRTLAAACGISDRSNTADLVERIKRGLTQDTLVILDECHLLSNTYRMNSFFACVEVLREIYDATNCGMVLIWTRIDALKGHSQRELQQIWRRGVHKLALPNGPTRGDVSAILATHGLDLPPASESVTVGKVVESPAAMVRQVSQADGLKAVTERLRYGRKLASRAGEPLAWRHVVRAHLMIVAQGAAPDPGWD